MPTITPIAYNTGAPIGGTTQLGSLAIGTTSQDYGAFPSGARFWATPDEELHYVVAYPVPAGNHPNPLSISGVSCYVGFFKTPTKTESDFLDLANYISVQDNDPQNFTDSEDAILWLNNNGYWTNFRTSHILSWNIQNTSSYSGTGTTITDLQGLSNGTLVGTISYSGGSPKYLEVQGSPTEYIYSVTNLNPYLDPTNTGTAISIFVWVYPTGNGCIVNEQGSSGDPNNAGWHDSQIEIVSGALKFRVWPLGSPFLTSNINPTLNTWNYIGFTYSGTTLTGYLNGQNVGSTTVTRQTPYNQGGGVGLYYSLGIRDSTNMSGGAGTSATFRFGAFDVYNIGLTGTDVQNNFDASKAAYGL